MDKNLLVYTRDSQDSFQEPSVRLESHSDHFTLVSHFPLCGKTAFVILLHFRKVNSHLEGKGITNNSHMDPIPATEVSLLC
jgi:hypothetical protein